MVLLYYFFLFLSLRDLGLAGTADAIDIKREAVLAESLRMHILHGNTDLGRLDLHHLTTHRTDLMTVAGIVVTSLVLRRTLKTVTDYQAQLHEQVECIIHRGPAHMEIHLLEQFLIQFF